MGIKRLLSTVRPLYREIKMEELEGKRLGIDAMAWIYQAFFSFGEYVDNNPLAMLRIFENKFKLLERNKIDFIFVIDGRELPCKKANFDKKA